jgi:hypothetical protein
MLDPAKQLCDFTRFNGLSRWGDLRVRQVMLHIVSSNSGEINIHSNETPVIAAAHAFCTPDDEALIC